MIMRPAVSLLFLAGLCFVLSGCGDDLSDEERKATLQESGLRILDIREGKGEGAKAGDMLEVNYVGTFKLDGKEFDRSKDPFRFVLGEGGVIKGWDEGLVGMKAGGKRKLWVPSSLAYGPRGAGTIPANADLVFEVELLRIVPPVKFEIIDQVVGDGPAAKAGDSVSVHYTGTLEANGRKFDSSHDRGQPFEFKLGAGQVIKGWDAGVVGMKVGGKRKLIIPYDMAYGPAGDPPTIPPKADLVFEVELLGIK